MGTPAQATVMTPAAGPIPVAFLGRTSTAEMQDPGASPRRQLRTSAAALPAGCQIVAHYWDIESGRLDLDQRGHGQAWQQFTRAGVPRDGGLADLLADAARPPGFFPVVPPGHVPPDAPAPRRSRCHGTAGPTGGSRPTRYR
jgi:site-specific DNA recombinase